MANSSTGMTGTARFNDCGCGNCQAGRTHDDNSMAHIPDAPGLAELAKRHDPRFQAEPYA